MTPFTVCLLNSDRTGAIVEHTTADDPHSAYVAVLRSLWADCEPDPETYPFDPDQAAAERPLLSVFAGHLQDLSA